MHAAQPTQPSSGNRGSTHLTLGPAGKWFLAHAERSSLCVIAPAACAENLTLFCLGQQQEPPRLSASSPADRLSLSEPFPLTGRRHPDADVELSLSAPEGEGKGYEVQVMET